MSRELWGLPNCGNMRMGERTGPVLGGKASREQQWSRHPQEGALSPLLALLPAEGGLESGCCLSLLSLVSLSFLPAFISPSSPSSPLSPSSPSSFSSPFLPLSPSSSSSWSRDRAVPCSPHHLHPTGTQLLVPVPQPCCHVPSPAATMSAVGGRGVLPRWVMPQHPTACPCSLPLSELLSSAAMRWSHRGLI